MGNGAAAAEMRLASSAILHWAIRWTRQGVRHMCRSNSTKLDLSMLAALVVLLLVNKLRGLAAKSAKQGVAVWYLVSFCRARLQSRISQSNLTPDSLGWQNRSASQPHASAGPRREHGEPLGRPTAHQHKACLGPAGASAALRGLREMRSAQVCCDVTVEVGPRSSFRAHRCVLAASSEPLRAMFRGDFREGTQDTVVLGDVDPTSFELLLDFLYGGEVDITCDNAKALLELATRFGVVSLQEHCCCFLSQVVSAENAFGLLSLADRYSCRQMRGQLLQYVLNNFQAATASSPAPPPTRPTETVPDWQQSGGFLHLRLQIVLELLSHDDLVREEADVWRAAAAWVGCGSTRVKDADEVFSCCRLALIPAAVLAGEVEPHPLMQTDRCRAYIHEAYRYQALPAQHRSAAGRCMGRRATARRAGRAPPQGRARWWSTVRTADPHETPLSADAALKARSGDRAGPACSSSPPKPAGDVPSDHKSDSAKCAADCSGDCGVCDRGSPQTAPSSEPATGGPSAGVARRSASLPTYV